MHSEGLVRTTGQRKDVSWRGHSPPVKCRSRDRSGKRKKASQRGALTSCKVKSEGLVRTAEECRPARGTHPLSGAERGTGQDSNIKLASEGHSHPFGCRGTCQDGEKKSASEGAHSLLNAEQRTGQDSERMDASQRGALTHCGVQSEGLVRTAKECQSVWATHQLSSTERGTGQDSRRTPASEGHSRPVERRARDISGQRIKVSEQGALTGC
jgi:hypothetical protein